MLEMGIPVGAGTDGTRVSSYNPWPALYWLVSGKTMGGTQLFADDNRLSREEALRLFTVGSAWFSQEEPVKGRIAPGQYADFAVLSDDYFTVPEERIKDIESVLTVVGGKVVYAAKPFETPGPAAAPGRESGLVAGRALRRISARAAVMRSAGRSPRMMKRLRCAVGLVLALAWAGCNAVGPSAITNGRGTYNAVINKTEDEQILTLLVRQRYDETFGLLAVSSVTASIRVGASVGANAGIGPESAYAGNLVPLSAQATYEENPTISYIPLRGEQFVERMLAPISLEQALLLSRASTDEIEVLRWVVRRVNGLGNPLYSPERAGSDFERFIDLYVRLREHGVLDIVRSQEGEYEMLLHGIEGEDAQQVREFLTTLGIRVDLESQRDQVLLPMTFLVGAPRTDAVDLETPSVLEVIRAASAGVEVPEEHLSAGIARPPAPRGAERASIVSIRSSKTRPENAAVAVEHRGWWFSIDATDTRSKQSFMILRTLIGMRLDQTVPSQQAPVLTVPVVR